MVFYPMPAIILAKRKGLKYATLSLVAAGLIITMLLGVQAGVIYLLLYSPIAVALSYGICKDENPNKTILMGSLAFMISFVIIILLIQALMGINYIQELKDIYSQGMSMYKEMLQQSPVQGDAVQETIDNVDVMGNAIVEYIGKMFPSILIFAAVVMSTFNYIVASKLAKRFSINIRQHEGLNYFSFPRTFIVAMAAMLLISYFLNIFDINASIIQLNLFMLCYIAMAVQGVCVLGFYLTKAEIKRILRGLILIFAFFTPMMVQILAVVGMLDLGLDLRKIRKIS
jgi:uncharacterized protein YybS (DUF2232 family)